MTKTKQQRQRNKLADDKAKARNRRKRRSKLLTGKKPVRTRAQRRRCVVHYKVSQGE